MPILGILASAMTGNLNVNSYESIATTTVGGGGQVTITFSSIPQTYTHLQIRCMSLSNVSFNNNQLRINGDTGANYTFHQLGGNGATLSAYGQGTGIGSIPVGQGGTSVYPGVDIIDILEYTNANKYKVVRSISGVDSNGTGQGLLLQRSGAWLSTSAVTTITISGDSSGTFQQYSSFALYGIKGA